MTRHELILVVEQALSDAGLKHKELNRVLRVVSSGVDEVVKSRFKEFWARWSEMERDGWDV